MNARNPAVAAGRNVVVVGTQWGDEGKGKVVDWLTDHAQTVVCMLPGHEHEGDEFACDRELVQVDGRWTLRAL